MIISFEDVHVDVYIYSRNACLAKAVSESMSCKLHIRNLPTDIANRRLRVDKFIADDDDFNQFNRSE